MTEPGLDAIRAARRELDETIDEIRKVPGYEQFLAPPTFDDVARAASACPIVYFAAAEPGGLALVVRGADVVHIPLEQLTADSLRMRVTAHLDKYGNYRVDRNTHHEDWYRSLDEITAWLWGAAVGPVLPHLGPTSEAVFVPGGLLGLLPLHAAWTEDPTQPTGRRYALDSLAISYTPNARSLQVAQEAAAGLAPIRLLAVAEPRPVPASELPSAPYEAMTVLSGFGRESTVLRGGEATRLRFRSESSRATVLHLACHGYADLADPLDSGLLMAGGPVTLRDLLDDYRLQVRLAVLSACETALPGTELPDEVVALPTGLLQAGVTGIVASQWSVPDRASAMLMAEFYRRWSRGEVSVASALRSSQLWLRDTPNQKKREAWRAHAGQPWLPAEVAEYFDTAMLGQEPDGRAHEDIHMWAAFAHVGA
jgi:hypothetical protein